MCHLCREADAIAAHLGMDAGSIVVLSVPPLGLRQLTRDAELELAEIVAEAVRFVDYTAVIGEMSQTGWNVTVTRDVDGKPDGLIGTDATLSW